MKYAIIKTGGKQYRVSEGDIIEVERLTTAANESFSFPEVLLVTVDEAVTIGQPIVDGFTVSAKVLDHIRGEKLRVAKFKAKARYRRVMGHRQELTRVQIEAISDGKPVKAPKVTKAVESKEVKEKAPVVKKPVKKVVKK